MTFKSWHHEMVDRLRFVEGDHADLFGPQHGVIGPVVGPCDEGNIRPDWGASGCLLRSTVTGISTGKAFITLAHACRTHPADRPRPRIETLRFTGPPSDIIVEPTSVAGFRDGFSMDVEYDALLPVPAYRFFRTGVQTQCGTAPSSALRHSCMCLSPGILLRKVRGIR